MMRAASSSSSASDGVRGGGSGKTKLSKIAGRSTGVRCRSIGTSTLTGPVGGVSASTAARVSTPIACCAERMRYALFETERSMPSWSGASCTVPSLAIDEFRRGLAGDVQHRRAGEARLDQSADGVRRARPGGREDHAEPAGDARIAVRHVRAAEFAARHDEADGVAPADRIQHRDVVHRGDAERGGHAALREEFGHQIADGVVARHLELLFVAAKLEQAVWSVNRRAFGPAARLLWRGLSW